jgi:hypothetical protein
VTTPLALCGRQRGDRTWQEDGPEPRTLSGSGNAADARLLAKAGRFVWYRDSGPSLTITRLQQVEHEAYLTLLAGQAGAVVPQSSRRPASSPRGSSSAT